eukprot:1158767-Pelagomonas_calceolata.AAC.4
MASGHVPGVLCLGHDVDQAWEDQERVSVSACVHVRVCQALMCWDALLGEIKGPQSRWKELATKKQNLRNA